MSALGHNRIATRSPAQNPRFADIGYYASFAPLCDCYPCHLHINLDERYRNRGIGSALIAAFAALAESAGRSGIHVVTGEQARNVRFYEKNEFRPLATARWNGADAVFMGRLLRPRDAASMRTPHVACRFARS